MDKWTALWNLVSNPIVLLLLFLLILAVVVIALIQGREISFWPPKISAKQQKIGYSATVQISEEVFKKAFERTSQQLHETSLLNLSKIQDNAQPVLSKQASHAITGRVEIEKRLFDLMIRIHGPAMGMGHPKWRYYWKFDWGNLLHNIPDDDPRIPQNLKGNIQDFFTLTEPFLHGDDLAENEFQMIVNLGKLIISEFDIIEMRKSDLNN